MLGAKIILDIHDILPEFFCQKFDKPVEGIIAKSLLIIEKLSVRFADHVVVANDIWREKIISRDKIIPERCTTYLNYPNLEFFSGLTHKAKRHDLRIIYPGHLSHHHGVDIGIKALALVKEVVPSVRFDIYPSSWILPYRNFLGDLIDDLNLRKNVRFLEPVTIEELANIYASIDIGIVTKREGIFSSEAFSTKIFDYMAAGLPIIASKTEIDQYYFDDSMITFFEPENHEDLARRIVELHRNPQKAKSMVENAKRFVAENNWGLKKPIYLDLVDSLVSSKRTEQTRAKTF